MSNMKEQYENLINNADLFDIDKEQDSSLYKTEVRKYILLVVKYYKDCIWQGIDNLRSTENPIDTHPFAKYGGDLYECIIQCLKSYNKSQGLFINYLAVAVSRIKKRVDGKESMSAYRCGIAFPVKEKKLISTVCQYVNSIDGDLNDAKVQQKIAIFMNLPICEVNKLIEINHNAVVAVSNRDGDEDDLFDFIANKELSAYEKLERKDFIVEFFNQVENTFNACQDRQKPLLMKLLTIKLVPEIEDAEIFDDIEDFSFIDNLLLHDYIAGASMPLAKDIAKEFHISAEGSVSRTYHNFIEKVKKELS